MALEAEALLGALEDAEATVFASGMTAWTSICLTVLGQGRALALPTSGYYSLEGFATGILERFGVEVRRYDVRDAADFRRACEGAALAIIETPSNPLLTLTDIEVAAEAAHAGGALLCCDSTFATPLLQRPLDLGADLAWQSATKYLAGHSDVLAGVVTTRDSALRERLVLTRRTIGGVLAPDPAWLLLRGLRTLHVRVPRQVATATELARRLAEHPAVREVHYPGLAGHPDHELALRQMPAGAGGVLAFELADGAAAGSCEDNVRLVRCATSLGGFESLIERRARIEPEGRVPEGLLRLSVGLEHVDDLWDDLTRAIAVIPAESGATVSERVGRRPGHPRACGMLRSMEHLLERPGLQHPNARISRRAGRRRARAPGRAGSDAMSGGTRRAARGLEACVWTHSLAPAARLPSDHAGVPAGVLEPAAGEPATLLSEPRGSASALLA